MVVGAFYLGQLVPRRQRVGKFKQFFPEYKKALPGHVPTDDAILGRADTLNRNENTAGNKNYGEHPIKDEEVLAFYMPIVKKALDAKRPLTNAMIDSLLDKAGLYKLEGDVDYGTYRPTYAEPRLFPPRSEPSDAKKRQMIAKLKELITELED
jgi:hypothetical protein